jgi:predicted GTPase
LHHHGQAPGENGEGRPVILVGNPNAGKSVVFGWLTGRYVEVARGTMTVADDRVPLIDTPGTNSLSPRSDDERVTRDILLAESRAVLQVADAKNLRRTLLLSTQLAELGVPIALDLNMADGHYQRARAKSGAGCGGDRVPVGVWGGCSRSWRFACDGMALLEYREGA